MKYNNLYLDGNHYKRVNKTKARNLYNEGVIITVFPILADTHSPWFVGGYVMDKTNIDKIEDGKTFDDLINAFESYNCNSELGLYAKYYIKLDN